MSITVVGIDPGARSWGWFAVHHDRSFRYGVHRLVSGWGKTQSVLEEMHAWLDPWVLPCRFIVEMQPGIGRQDVIRTEAAICAIAHVLRHDVRRYRPSEPKAARAAMARAYWKLGDLDAPMKDQEHILDAAFMVAVEDER